MKHSFYDKSLNFYHVFNMFIFQKSIFYVIQYYARASFADGVERVCTQVPNPDHHVTEFIRRETKI